MKDHSMKATVTLIVNGETVTAEAFGGGSGEYAEQSTVLNAANKVLRAVQSGELTRASASRSDR